MTVANTAEEFAKLVNDPNAKIIRNRESLLAYSKESGTPLNRLSAEERERFVNGVEFSKSRKAVCTFYYGEIVNKLTFNEFKAVIEKFGIGLRLFEIYPNSKCVNGRCESGHDGSWCSGGPFPC